jgi:hypothetical protein
MNTRMYEQFGNLILELFREMLEKRWDIPLDWLDELEEKAVQCNTIRLISSFAQILPLS